MELTVWGSSDLLFYQEALTLGLHLKCILISFVNSLSKYLLSFPKTYLMAPWMDGWMDGRMDLLWLFSLPAFKSLLSPFPLTFSHLTFFFYFLN